MIRLKSNRCSTYVLAAMALPLFASAAVRADEVTDWHETLVTYTKAFNPLVASRDAALMSTAVFDAVNGVERRYVPFYVTATAPRGASKRAAAVQAAYVVLLARYPGNAGDLNAKRAASLAAIDDGASKDLGAAWGQSVANAILASRSNDGFFPPPPPPIGFDEIGVWRAFPLPDSGIATPGVGQQFVNMPTWGLPSPTYFAPPGAPPLASAQYLADYNEVKSFGAAVGSLRTQEQTDVANFWEGSRPVPLCNGAAIRLAKANGFELSDSARAMAMLNVAIADAAITCFTSKYDVLLWRPYTAIRQGDIDGVDGTIGDTAWNPLVLTHPHPEYPSGHCSLSGAGIAALGGIFGEDAAFTLDSGTVAGWVRSYPNAAAARADVINARVFAGLHFRTACNDGAALGQSIASYILANKMQRLHGEGE